MFLDGVEDPFAHRGVVAAEALTATAPDAVSYTQSRRTAEQLSDETVFTGAAEFWFPEEASALKAGAALRSAPLWAAGANARSVVAGRERTVLRTADFAHGRGVKGVFPFLRRADFNVKDFQRYWWHEHGPIAARTEGAHGYLQCHPLPASYDQGLADFDGVTELFWPDYATASAAMASRQMTEDQSTDAKNFVDTDSVRLFFAVEEIVLAP